MKQLMIGCPVLHREWIIAEWLKSVEVAADYAGFSRNDIGYVFVGDPRRDETFKVIETSTDVDVHVVEVEDVRPTDRRQWSHKRYKRMVELRNELLVGVRENEPALFLSLDSDILLHPNALGSMIEGLERFDAVGGKCYLSHAGTGCPNYGNIGREGRLIRRDAENGLFPVQVIMANKLMTPKAYYTNYKFHLQGEDTGWSLACAEVGLLLGWDCRVVSKHVFERDMLDAVDWRVGF